MCLSPSHLPAALTPLQRGTDLLAWFSAPARQPRSPSLSHGIVFPPALRFPAASRYLLTCPESHRDPCPQHGPECWSACLRRSPARRTQPPAGVQGSTRFKSLRFYFPCVVVLSADTQIRSLVFSTVLDALNMWAMKWLGGNSWARGVLSAVSLPTRFPRSYGPQNAFALVSPPCVFFLLVHVYSYYLFLYELAIYIYKMLCLAFFT